MGEKARLTGLQSAKLFALVEQEFTSPGKDDKEFAAYAAEKFGIPITHWHVRERRQDLEIPSFRDSAKPAADLSSFTERMLAVERQLAADQKEFRGLAELFIDLKNRVALIEKALRLKGHFEGFTK